MTDIHYMQMALDIAAQAQGQTNPNPMVGAVLVKDDRVVGFGAHLKAGEPHAEVHAFRMAGEHAQGATLYVTLEPCSHHGRTPPCADLVVRSNVKRVVVAMQDPNPLVAGQGIQRIREAGIEVEVGVLEDHAIQLNERFLHNMRTKRPFVVVKTAMTLDGKIATHTGDSRWITGPAARTAVHKLRNEVDGILVGIGTVLADDPELTTRIPDGSGKNPTRIILDSTLRVPETAKVLDTTVAPTWIVTGTQIDEEKATRLRERGVRLFTFPDRDVERLLQELYQQGITHLLVEGGATVNGAFLEAGMIDKVLAFIAPKLIGGASAPTPFGGSGFAKMSQGLTLRDISITAYGNDFCIMGYPDLGGDK